MNEEGRHAPQPDESKPATPPLDVGKELRKIRERRGETLEALSKRSRIPIKYLKALEENRHEAFPARSYLRGFLENYCREIDADFDVLWQALSLSEQDSESSTAKQNAKAQPPLWRTPHWRPEWVWPAGLVAVGLLLAALLILWLVRRAETPAPAAAPSAAAATGAAAPKAPESPAKPKAARPAEAKTVRLSHAIIDFGQDVWASIAADGVPHFEGRVPKGKEQRWKFKKSLSFKLSSPNAIQLRVNDKLTPLPAPDPDGTYRVYAPTTTHRQ